MRDILDCSYFLALSVKVTVEPSVRAERKAVVGLVLTNIVFVPFYREDFLCRASSVYGNIAVSFLREVI